jgi:hypothetical protein
MHSMYPVQGTNGQTIRVAISAPPVGRIVKLMVVQYEPTDDPAKNKALMVLPRLPAKSPKAPKPPASPLEGFKFTIYNSILACPPGVTQTSAEPTVDALLEWESQLAPVFVVAANNDRYLLADGTDGSYFPAGIPYLVNDSDLADDAQPKLCLKLEVDGTWVGTKTFAFILGIEQYRI